MMKNGRDTFHFSLTKTSLALALVLAVSGTACGRKSKSNIDLTPAPTSTPSRPPAPAPTPSRPPAPAPTPSRPPAPAPTPSRGPAPAPTPSRPPAPRDTSRPYDFEESRGNSGTSAASRGSSERSTSLNRLRGVRNLESLSLMELIRLTDTLIQPTSEQSPSGANMATWQQDAQRRIRRRPNPDTITSGHTWGAAETAMNATSTRGKIRSINELDRMYPHAIPNTEYAFYQIWTMIKNYNTERSPDNAHKRAAAIRFLARVASGFIQPNEGTYTYAHFGEETDEYQNRDNHTGLTVKEYLALSWYAINDSTRFPENQDRQDRKQGLFNNLAIIQRAHNDHGHNAHGVRDGSIIWDSRVESDQPSCTTGTYKFLISHLEFSLQEVQLGDGPSLQEVSDGIREAHNEIFDNYYQNLREEDRISIQEAIREYNVRMFQIPRPPGSSEPIRYFEYYTNYVNLLRETLRNRIPGVTNDLFNQIATADTLLALMDSSI